MAYSPFIFIVLVIGSTPMAAGLEDTSNAAIQKVIQMLQDMVATAKKEKHEEEVKFAEFSTFCASETADLKNEIASAAEQIELLTSEIEKLTSDVSGLGKDIAKLSSDVASMEADVKAQTAQREKEHAVYEGESQDYAETLDALDRAIMVLSKQDYDRKQASASLLQVSELTMLPERVKAMVSAFMAMMDSDDQAPTPPEANAYEFQSGGIVDMLKKLQDDFRKESKQCDKEEMNSKHAYDMVMQDLTDSISRANSDMQRKSQEKEEKTQKIAEDKGLLAATEKDKAEDEKTLSDLEAECFQKSESFKEKQQLRTEEIDALGKAIEVLSSEAVSGGAQHLSLVAKSGSSLVQLRSSLKGAAAQEGIRHRVTEFLAARAKALKSKQLGLLA